MAIREGKNREVRNVVESLGLQANRLIRVSFGPFQLGDMREGEVVEIKTRILRDQLGERIAAEAGCDFSAPVVVRAAEKPGARPAPTSAERQPRLHRKSAQVRALRAIAPSVIARRATARHAPLIATAKSVRTDAATAIVRALTFREKPQGRPRRGHAWRAEDAPLGRHYRGAGSKTRQRDDAPAGAKRTGLIADRKGRRVLVERFGDKPAATIGKPPRKSRQVASLPAPPPQGGREQKSSMRPSAPQVGERITTASRRVEMTASGLIMQAASRDEAGRSRATGPAGRGRDPPGRNRAKSAPGLHRGRSLALCSDAWPYRKSLQPFGMA